MNDNDTFYLVYNFSGSKPTYRHDSYEQANAEAERLAKENPNNHFFVLQAISVSKFKTVETVKLLDIPF